MFWMIPRFSLRCHCIMVCYDVLWLLVTRVEEWVVQTLAELLELQHIPFVDACAGPSDQII